MRLIANLRRPSQLLQERTSPISNGFIQVNPDVIPRIPSSEISFEAINDNTTDDKAKDTATMNTKIKQERPTIKFSKVASKPRPNVRPIVNFCFERKIRKSEYDRYVIKKYSQKVTKSMETESRGPAGILTICYGPNLNNVLSGEGMRMRQIC